MTDLDKLDDPIWEYVLGTKLAPYIPYVREFWKNIADINIIGTGVFKFNNDNAPPGLLYRVTNTPVRSPIKNVQVFPFVPVNYLQLTNVAGGALRMVSRVCSDNKFSIEEFTIIAKSNLPSTYHQGQIVAFVPSNILNEAQKLGKWIYFTVEEMYRLSTLTDIPDSIKFKIKKYVLE